MFIKPFLIICNQVLLKNTQKMSTVAAAPTTSLNSSFGLSPDKLPMINPAGSLINPIKYHNLGIAVSNIAVSTAYYEKVGFKTISVAANNANLVCMVNRGGLEIYLFSCDKGIEENKNILMDFPTEKYAGHTHISFSVPSVDNTRVYLESLGLTISGERKVGDKLYALFTRDPDMTTLEFENNTGDNEDVVMTSELIGYPKNLDHIGTRVFEPEDRMNYYADKFGFNRKVSTYAPGPDVLKNGRPWIVRTETGVDMNFIINANMKSDQNILIKDGIVRPGVVYAGFSVPDIEATYTALKSGGVYVVREEEVASSKWSCLIGRFKPSLPEHTSLFVEDPDLNLFRFVQA